jgi:drug/metabolite transporter (DMT)-like permease
VGALNSLVLALTSIALSVAAQFTLKAGTTLPATKAVLGTSISWASICVLATNYLLLIGLALYALSAVLWISVLARWDVSKAYPMVGLGFILTLAIGAALGEQVTGARVLGVLLVTSGILLIART